MNTKNFLIAIGGDTIADHENFTAAEVSVLKALALAQELQREVRLSNKTRADPAQPWRITVQSRVTRSLEDRKRPPITIQIVGSGDVYYLDAYVVRLTDHGLKVLAALAEAEAR